MAKILGIDLGTTYSVVSAVKASPQVITNRENQRLTRSAVCEYNSKVMVGEPVMRRGKLAPTDTIISVKRLMGRAFNDPHVQRLIKDQRYTYSIEAPDYGTPESLRIVMGGKQFSPAQISAFILKKLKEDAEFRDDGSISDCVITVPAYFSEKQRVATFQAGQLAGLNVARLLHEPTAAAIRYGVEDLGGSGPKTVLVYDLGGGTFDVSIMVIAGGSFPEVKIKGDMWLGGDNFDELLMDKVLRDFQEQCREDLRGNLGWMFEFRENCKKAKEELTNLDCTDVLQYSPSNRDMSATVMRSEFEAVARPLVYRSMQLVESAIGEAGFTDKEIDYVIVAGGSSSMPIVQEALETRFGRDRLLRNLHPKECVAEGAAILAARLAESTECPSCGTVNSATAARCSKCGLELLQFLACFNCGTRNGLEDERCVKCGQRLGVSGTGATSISGRNYIIETVSGPEVLVAMNDLADGGIRTKIFNTSMPNQRVICARIYCDETQGRTDQSELQCEAYAILPPGLLQGTPIRLYFLLTENLIFNLSAELPDGRKTAFLKLSGDDDAGVIKELEKAEADEASLGQDLREQIRAEFEAKRENILSLIENAASVKDALAREKAVREARAIAEELSKLPKTAAQTRTDFDRVEIRLSWFAGFSQDYAPLLEDQTNQKLVGYIQRGTRVIEGRNTSEAAAFMEDSDSFYDGLKDYERFWWRIMWRIDQVYRKSPARGRELDSIREEAISTLQQGQQASFKNAVDHLAKALDDSAGLKIDRCPYCGRQIEEGQRKCPEGHDLWLLAPQSKGAGASA